MNADAVMVWPDEDPLPATGEARRADLPVTTVLRPCAVVAAAERITAALGSPGSALRDEAAGSEQVGPPRS